MTWNIVTASFNSTNYKRGQRFIDKLSTKLVSNTLPFDKDDLYKSKFYKDNKDWFKTSPSMKVRISTEGLFGNPSSSLSQWRN